MAKTFNFASMPNSVFSLQKIVFMRHITKVNRGKKKQLYLPTLTKCHSLTPSFNPQMSKGA